jgi:hypothetical protein
MPLECSEASPVCRSGESSEVKMNVEHWWNDTDKGQPKYLEGNLSQCHSVYRSHVD